MDSTNNDAIKDTSAGPRNTQEVFAILRESWSSINDIQLIVIRRVGFMLFARAPFIIANILLSILMSYYPSIILACISLIIHIVSGTLAAIILVPVNIASVRKSINLPLDMNIIKRDCSAVQTELLTLIVICITAINFSIIILRAFLSFHIFTIILIALAYILLTLCMTSIYMMAFPTIVLRKVDFFSALSVTFEKLQENWKTVFGCYGIIYGISSLLITVAVMLIHHALSSESFPLLMLAELIIYVPLFWLVPWLYATGGILFRELNGLKISTKPLQEPKQQPLGTILLILTGITIICYVISSTYFAKLQDVDNSFYKVDQETAQRYMTNF